ncbi:MAG: hypothetical protein MK209_03000 [Planctomycetes bacterium]|nr:hypothetical protein [Planctomycetota bacterium]
MAPVVPAEATRDRMLQVIGLSFLFPGLGHIVAGARTLGLAWMLIANGALLAGFQFAGYSQFDFGFAWELLGVLKIAITLPESLNFGGTVLIANFASSVEFGGSYAEHLPYRQLGYLLSGCAGILSVASAPHAAGLVLQQLQPNSQRTLHPGKVALFAILVPGLGHWVAGRRFKAKMLGITLFAMFVLGLAMAGFAAFDRQRHGYYWIGQMFHRLPAWLAYLPLLPLKIGAVYPYQDTGFTFTSVAGLFNIVVALDAYHRAETDWLTHDKEKV